MGYFSNGFVFTSEPDFHAAANVAPERLARGYKHIHQPVWLLDLWKPRGKLRSRRAPFCDPLIDAFRTDCTGIDTSTSEFLTALERLQQAIGLANPGSEVSCIHLALAVAEATRCPTFLFAADDEETDMASNALTGTLVSFGCRLDRLSVQYASGQAAVAPLTYPEDGDEEGFKN